MSSELNQNKKSKKNSENDGLNNFISENKKVLKFTLIGFCFLGLVARATLTIPHTFSAGETISASEVNANFQAVTSSLTNTIAKAKPNSVKNITPADGIYDGKKLKTSGSSSGLLFDSGIIPNPGMQTAGSGGSQYTVFEVPSNGWYKIYLKLSPTYTDSGSANINYGVALRKANSINLATGITTGSSSLASEGCAFSGGVPSGCNGLVTEKYFNTGEFIYVDISYWWIDGSGPPADAFHIQTSSELIIKQVN